MDNRSSHKLSLSLQQMSWAKVMQIYNICCPFASLKDIYSFHKLTLNIMAIMIGYKLQLFLWTQNLKKWRQMYNIMLIKVAPLFVPRRPGGGL